MSILYFDNNATTCILPPILDAMLPWLGEHYGNPSSSHVLGQAAKQGLGAARGVVAKFLGASPAEVIFTSGATESIHTAILGAVSAQPGKKRIVTSKVEHAATLQLLEHLAQQGFDVVQVPVLPSGALDMAVLREAINAQTALVTLMHANNETGVLFPVQEAAAIAHQHGALLHVDAAQTAGKLPLNVREIDCDLLSFSGHKLHAPKGIGVLFVRKGISLSPLLFGHQERNRRGGTENLPGIIGLAAACEIAQTNMDEKLQNISTLRDALERSVLAKVAFARVNGLAARVGNTSNICFCGLNGEELLFRLEKHGIVASRGSACTAGGTDPSHVLLAMGLSREDALSSLRFSLSGETTQAEVDALVAVVSNVANEMALQAAA